MASQEMKKVLIPAEGGDERDLGTKFVLMMGFLLMVLATSPQLLVKAPLFLMWTLLSAVLAVLQGLYVSYQLVMIIVSLATLTILLALRRAYTIVQVLGRKPVWLRVLSAMNKASSWDEYCGLAHAAFGSSKAEEIWANREDDMPSATLLRRAINDLREGRETKSDDEFVQKLRFTLSGLTKRNHLGIEAAKWYPPTAPLKTKVVIDEYLDELKKSLHHVTYSDNVPLDQKIQFLNRVRRTVGVTALCLSGGGATTMFHGGHLLGLIETGLYDKIHVVSGTSGGSIMAAMVGCKTKEEMLKDVLVPTVSTDYTRDGEQQRRNLRFFPPLWKQMINFARTRVLVDSEAFKKTCAFYWGDITFQEAHERTGKVLCISVSAQRAGSQSDAVQRLLMNHVTTPHVTLASAVAASCALPGILRPMRLEAKDANGVVAPFEVDGVEWVDGSIQADTPFRRMATLFNVSNFVVCQVNFHVRLVVEDSSSPYAISLGPNLSWGTNIWSKYNRLFRGAELSIRMRATMLSKLGLMPSLYGNDIGKVFSQKYHGDVTISPRFNYLQSIGLSAICNPTVNAMKEYLDGGKRAVWPHVSRLRRMLVLETCLAENWMHLRNIRRSSTPGMHSNGSLPSRDTIDDDDDDADLLTNNSGVPPLSGSANAAVSFARSPIPTSGHNNSTRGAPASSTDSANDKSNSSKTANADSDTRYRQLEWEYRRLQTRFERLRSENLDLRRRLEDIRHMCTPVEMAAGDNNNNTSSFTSASPAVKNSKATMSMSGISHRSSF